MNFSPERRKLLAAAASVVSLPSYSSNPSTLTMGIVPQWLPTLLFQKWKPLLDTVAQEVGVAIQIKLYPSIPQFELAFGKGEFDLVYLNPYHAVMAKKSVGYEPLVRNSANLSGVLVTRSDSDIKHLSALNGQKIAFPAPNAFGASLYMRALLTKKYKVSFTPVYVQTHSNVYSQVKNRIVQAGGGIQSTLDQQPKDTRDLLHVLFNTPESASHPIAAHPRLSAKLQNALQASFLGLNATDSGKELLKGIAFQRVVKTSYAEYDALDDLQLEKFLVGESS